MKHVNLDVYRVVYVLALLTVYPGALNPAVGTLPPQMFAPPWGVHWLMSSLPTPGLIVAMEFIRWAALVLLLFKLVPRFASLVAWGSWLWLGAVAAGLGKIDHDLIMAAPLLAFGCCGWDEPSSRGVYVVAAMLSSFYLTAGLIKLCSGWLNFQASAVSSVFTYYEAVYGRDVGAFRELSFGVFKALDVATVVLECSFVVVLFRPRLLPLWLLAAWGFHEGIHAALGINFKKLSALYVLFVPVGATPALAWVSRLRFEPLARWLVAGGVVLATGLRTLEAPAPETFNWYVPGVRTVWEWGFPCWALFFVVREGVRAWRARGGAKAIAAN